MEKENFRIELDCNKQQARELLDKVAKEKRKNNEDIQKIIIREIKSEDKEDFLEIFEGIRNNPNNMPFYACKTKEDTESYFERITSGEEGKRVIVPALTVIDSKGKEKCIGILPIDKYGNGDIGYAINPKYQSRGILKIALPLVIYYTGFYNREILDATTHPENIPSNFRLKNTGFKYKALTATRYASQDGYVEPRNNYILTQKDFLELLTRFDLENTIKNCSEFYINNIPQNARQLLAKDTEEVKQTIIKTEKDLLYKQWIGTCRICVNLSVKTEQLQSQSEKLEKIKEKLKPMKLISEEIERELEKEKTTMVIEEINLNKEEHQITLSEEELEEKLKQIDLILKDIKEKISKNKGYEIVNDNETRKNEILSNDKLQEELFAIQGVIKNIEKGNCLFK